MANKLARQATISANTLPTMHSRHVLVEPVQRCCTVVTSQPDAVDVTVTFTSYTDVLSSSRIAENTTLIIHCAQRICTRFASFPRLHGSGAAIPGIGTLIYSWYCDIGISSGDGICSRSRDAKTSA